MHSTSTATVVVQVRGPTVTYGTLKFSPIVDSRAHSIDVEGFTIRAGGSRFTLDEFPVSHAVPERAKNDILVNTWELDESERASFHEIDFELPDYDESHRLHFRYVEHDAMPELLFLEVEDEVGNWLAVEDTYLLELLPESFRRAMEASVVSGITSHNLDLLPLAAE
ncbi:hypothetical protein [Sphingosinicella sp. BN140058]|uniref:hypothetical protein n=1 Tax=Sphingosinicella sp. BN140058 TaxID=1892855 RepID=UPI0010117600|nr:hypothetical protein [Sphingosinicella sp. BN140058]QAY80127.1 hypothetical protein ETR14_26150 [Sphingosinicella sp. BN140058]